MNRPNIIQAAAFSFALGVIIGGCAPLIVLAAPWAIFLGWNSVSINRFKVLKTGDSNG